MNNYSSYGKYFTYKDEVSRTISWGHWFTFLNVFLTILLGSAYILYTPTADFTSLGNFYLITSWLGHFSCLVFILYMLFFFPLSFIGSLRVYRIYAVAMSVLLLAIMLVDIKIYQQIKIHLNLSVVELFFEQEGFSTGINFNFLYIAIPLLVLVECYFSHLAWKHIYIHNHKKTTNTFVAIFLLSFIATHLLNIWASAYKYTPITQQKTLFPAYYPMTANTFLAEHGWITPASKASNKFHHFKTVHYPLENISIAPISNYMNVLVILVNGLNYDTAFSSKKEWLPELNNFATENSMFKKHYLGVNGHKEASFELVYGLPAQYISSIESNRYVPVIISEMRQQDYKIHAYISNPEAQNSLPKGQQFAGLRSNATSMYRSDNETANAAVKAISTWSNRPQFTLVSLNDLYANPNCMNNNATITPKEQQQLNKCLQNEDKLISMLKDSLNNNDLAQRTVVIITSVKTPEENSYSREKYHVPLIIHWPGINMPKSVDMLSGTQDLAPTIAKNILGITNNEESYSTGENLLTLQPRSWILSGTEREFQIISDSQTTIYDRQGNASIYSDTPGINQQPNMTTLIKAMKILNKFAEE